MEPKISIVRSEKHSQAHLEPQRLVNTTIVNYLIAATKNVHAFSSAGVRLVLDARYKLWTRVHTRQPTNNFNAA